MIRRLQAPESAPLGSRANLFGQRWARSLEALNLADEEEPLPNAPARPKRVQLSTISEISDRRFGDPEPLCDLADCEQSVHLRLQKVAASLAQGR